MRRLRLARDSVRVTVRGAEPERVLSACAARGVRIRSVTPVEDHTVTFKVSASSVGLVRSVAEKNQCKVERVRYSRAGRLFRKGRRRRFLALVLALMCCAAWLSSLFVWDVRVYGNERVSAARILRALDDCGVSVGTFWPSMQTDIVRAGVLLRVPELDWFTVNLRGSIAEVRVTERVDAPEVIDNDAPYELYAVHSGVVVRLSVLQGQTLVQRGDLVAAGQTLVSGAPADLRGGVRPVHALGSVRARTAYCLTACAPLTESVSVPCGEPETRWSLCAGKKRVNFGKSSSISVPLCDKIESVYACAIPGLVRLPFTLVRETVTPLTLRERPLDREAVRARLEQTLSDALRARIGADGEVISQHFTANEQNGLLVVTLRCECEQEIAAQRPCDVPITPMEEEPTDDRTND